jgi:hypothetical protein
MNRIGFISVNHFWTLTHEVGFHLPITPTALTSVSIQTALTHRNIHTEKGEKKKTRRKPSQKFFNFFSRRGRLDGHQMGKVGIGIYSCYLSWPALRTRELDRIQ